MPALLLRYLPHLLIGLAVIAGVAWFSHSRYTAGYDAAAAEFQAQLLKSAEDGRKAVNDAVAQAEEEQRKQREEQQRREQAARDQHEMVISEAHRKQEEWRSKYQRALATDASCQAWSREQVRCPL